MTHICLCILMHNRRACKRALSSMGALRPRNPWGHVGHESQCNSRTCRTVFCAARCNLSSGADVARCCSAALSHVHGQHVLARLTLAGCDLCDRALPHSKAIFWWKIRRRAQEPGGEPDAHARACSFLSVRHHRPCAHSRGGGFQDHTDLSCLRRQHDMMGAVSGQRTCLNKGQIWCLLQASRGLYWTLAVHLSLQSAYPCAD